MTERMSVSRYEHNISKYSYSVMKSDSNTCAWLSQPVTEDATNTIVVNSTNS